MIEAGQPLQHGPLEDHPENADRDGSDDQRRPVSDARDVQQEIGAERAHHVERAVREIDDVEHSEDHGEPKAEQRIERAVDQSHQELCVESLHIDRSFALNLVVSWRQPRRLEASGAGRYFFSIAHLLSDNGVNAWLPGTVPISL